MKGKDTISVWQFVLLLLSARLSSDLLLPADSLHALSLPDVILVTVFNGFLLLILLLPTCRVLRFVPEKDLAECAKTQSRWINSGFLLLYALVLVLDMVQFTDFAEKTVKAEFSVVGLTLLVLAASLLASFYGIQALSRTATVVAVFSAASLLFFAVMLLPQMDLLHFLPATVSEPRVLLYQALRELPRTAEVAAIGVLYPRVNGKVGKGCYWFVICHTIFSVLTCVTATGVLGDFAALNAYPYYAAVSVGHLGLLPRMDLVITALWLGTFFIRFSLFFWLFIDRFRKLFDKKQKLLPAVCISVGVALFLIGFEQGFFAQWWEEITFVYGGVLVLLCLVVPFVIKMGRTNNEKRNHTRAG